MSEFVAGKMQKYNVVEGFNLKFEDPKQQVMVKKGDIIFYDGQNARYRNQQGSEMEGKTPWLKGAIISYQWLVPSNESESPKAPKVEKQTEIPTTSKDYNPKTGGNFDSFVKEVNKPEPIKRKYSLETEDRRTVKEMTNFTQKEEKNAGGKLEVVGDQVSVKEFDETTGTIVSSSTVIPKSKKHSTEIIESEGLGATSSTKLKTGKKEEAAPKKSAFTVDATTPRVPEDATQEEVRKVTKKVINADESQDAKVVGRYKPGTPEVQNVDGIVIKRGTPEKVPATKQHSGDINTKAKVTAGSTPVMDLSEVVQDPQKPLGGAKKTAAAPKTEGQDYLSMLPEDWGDLHWTKKEKFVKKIQDIGFLKFLLSVETVNAIQNACKERLKELEK